MKKMMIVGCLLAAASFTANACTGMYAGKGATKDGSILIGRTVDGLPHNTSACEQICAAGTQVAFNGVTNKYRYICTPNLTGVSAGRYAGGTANEKGVILTGAITGATRTAALTNDSFKTIEQGGVGEQNLPDYLIGNAATAREAVKLLGDAIAEYGHAAPEIYMVADKDEAWYVEVYTGHNWAAVKMPEYQVAVFGNHFNLRGFDTNDVDNVMFSPNLVSRAVNEGFAIWADDKQTKLDLFLTYADANSVLSNYGNFRAWYGHRFFAPRTTGEYTQDHIPEHFYMPDNKISTTNMFDLMRARYEDISDDDLPTARTNGAIRVIGTTKQTSCHVLQLDCSATTPESIRGTVWSCLGSCEYGMFHPICVSQNFLPAAYTNEAQRILGYDPNHAADIFRRLSALAQSNRKWYGPGVRNYWRAREEKMAAGWSGMWQVIIQIREYASLWAYTRKEEEKSFAAAKQLYDELLWYAAANNHILGDGSGATDEPSESFKPSGEVR